MNAAFAILHSPSSRRASYGALLALALSGCNVGANLEGLRLANGATVEPDGAVIEPSGAVIEPSGEVVPPQAASEIVAYESDMCLVRARHFKGLVRIPCDQIAREPAP
jgi:hypothetical protein